MMLQKRAFKSKSAVGAALLVCLLLGFRVESGVAQIVDSASSVGERTVHLHINVPMQPRAISPLLFGSFLEPIGQSTYGGLWADVVENPSFEEGLWSAGNVADMLREDPKLRRASELGLPLPWHPLDARQGNRYLVMRGDAANSNDSLLLMGLPDASVGVWQRVYLPVDRTLEYAGSLAAKHVRGASIIQVSLRRHDHPEEVLASVDFTAGNTEWSRYPFQLQLREGSVHTLEPVDLVVSLSGEARAQIDSVSLLPADALDGLDPEEVAMARELHSPVIRFGGNFTSAYDWREGIGPREKRISTMNPSWGIPEYNTLGTDEFLHFCKLIGAEPQIALNLGTGTPEEAAAWVRYVDEHWNAGKGGLLWELGNELWGDWQVGYPTLQQVGAVTEATSRAVRAVDPKARLIATGADEDNFERWNAEQLKLPAGTFNDLSTHFVVEDSVELPNASADFRTQAALALPWGLGPRMLATMQQARSAARPEVRVAFTEWLMISRAHDSPNFTNLGGGLFAGSFLNMLVRNSDILEVSDMTGIMEFGGIWKRRGVVYGAPAYWVLRSYATNRPAWLLNLVSDAPTYSVTHGIRRLPEIKDVPYLDCTATEPEKRDQVQLHCVNLHPTRSIAAEIDLGSLRTTNDPVIVTTVAGQNLLQENDEEDPTRIHPRTETLTGAQGLKLRYSFPKQSVTLISIPVASR